MRWWRAYDEAVDDPKLQRLPPELFKHWFNMMCLASSHDGIIPPVADVAFKLRVNERKAIEIIKQLEQRGLIDTVSDGRMEPHNWNGRQYKSDVSTDRVKRFRERKRNVSATPPDTETDTDTEKKKDITPSDDWPKDHREQFWSAYPRKVSKETAVKALDRVRKAGKVTWPDLLAGVMRYAAAMADTETQFIKHPTTWLNGGCWDDDPAALQRSPGNGHPFGSKEHQRQETANAYRQLCEFAESGSDDRTGGSRSCEEAPRLLPFAKRS